jgi:hypothetical protein
VQIATAPAATSHRTGGLILGRSIPILTDQVHGEIPTPGTAEPQSTIKIAVQTRLLNEKTCEKPRRCVTLHMKSLLIKWIGRIEWSH